MDQLTYRADSLDQRIKELECELTELKAGAEQHNLSSLLLGFIESNVTPVVRAHINGAIIDANQAFLDMLGYTIDELRAIGWQKITPPEYAAADANAVKQIMLTGRAEQFEKDYIRKDGSRVPVLLGCTACDITGADVLALVIDLSAAKNSEMEDRMREEQFRLLVEKIPQICWIAGANSYVEWYNQRFADYIGLPREKGLDLAWQDLIHADDLEHVVSEYQRSVATGEPYEVEMRHRYNDGTYHWSLTRGIPSEFENGKIIRMIGTCTDINEHKRIQAELAEREAHFRMLADGIPQIVWTASAKGELNFFNHRWLEYSGLTMEQSLDGAWQLLLHAEDLPGYLEAWNESWRTGQTYEREFRLKRATGIAYGAEYRWHLCRAVPLRTRSNKLVKWFGTWTEIHEQKARL